MAAKTQRRERKAAAPIMIPGKAPLLILCEWVLVESKFESVEEIAVSCCSFDVEEVACEMWNLDLS